MVFSNENLIKKTIDESQILKEFNSKNYTKLFMIKTRTNAIRIWKIFFKRLFFKIKN